MLYSGCILRRYACKTLGRHTAHMFLIDFSKRFILKPKPGEGSNGSGLKLCQAALLLDNLKKKECTLFRPRVLQA